MNLARLRSCRIFCICNCEIIWRSGVLLGPEGIVGWWHIEMNFINKFAHFITLSIFA